MFSTHIPQNFDELTDQEKLDLYPELCPVCGEYVQQEVENTGFTPPDPTHYEVVRTYCECGWEE